MGVNDYDYHHLQDLKKMLECENAAQRLAYIPGEVHQINFFSTWFNNNCATVICGEHGSHELRLIIHEPRQGEMEENLESREIANYLSYGEVQSRADHIEDRLKNSENPILQVHTGQIDAFAHAYRGISLDELPMIRRSNLTTNLNPDIQLKPFDIVRRPGSSFSSSIIHSGIYLGDSKIAHLPDKDSRVKIDYWSSFLGNCSGGLVRYHPVIPYKHQDKINGIKEHIARAVASSDYEDYGISGAWQGSNRTNGNCQHFSNRCVLGLDFSESMTKFKKKVPLAEEIRDVDKLFRDLDITTHIYNQEKRTVENAVNR
jgi:hypothetical protein